jgi:hypothetical protein
MIVNRLSLYPHIGKNVELGPILRARVEDMQKKGLNTSLHAMRFTYDGDVLTLVTPFDSLETFEKSNMQLRSDEWVRNVYLSKVVPLCRRDYNNQIYYVLVPPAEPVSGKYIYRICNYPGPGQETAMGSILTEAAKLMQEEGRQQFRLSRQVFAPGGAVYVMSDTYQDLSEFETPALNHRERLTALLPSIGAISRAITSYELHEVVVPAPQR